MGPLFCYEAPNRFWIAGCEWSVARMRERVPHVSERLRVVVNGEDADTSTVNLP